ncbi:hypothetical protein GCM10017708_11880 [Arthrobacter citreus]
MTGIKQSHCLAGPLRPSQESMVSASGEPMDILSKPICDIHKQIMAPFKD